ncbi:hypothetical protein [Croceicoccus mobilis]|uniref:EthD domain-containing protein n=1 Tax=Croceicoccus mobilis TaxID=1703339 RepID=A0A916Z7T2_9SPHN|nr:hypothetical protein [Croceicoccus mobilis]GGD80741.1 hypothetical protein GCM10010990_33270 [Croceicoccus mobilis]
MTEGSMLESILVVYQNPLEGRLAAYDDWYTNIHIRDAMRLDGAIATQRFAVHPLQPVLDGAKCLPFHWAHTIYEWESAAASVKGHAERAGTPQMEITRDASFAGLRDFFFRPRHLSHGWSPQEGFRRGDAVLTVLLQPAGDPEEFVSWFAQSHAPWATGLPGLETAGLFTLHEEQSLPITCPWPMVAIYGLSDAGAALAAWGDGHDRRDPAGLAIMVAAMEQGCWQKRIERLTSGEVLSPPPAAQAAEARARLDHAGRYFTAAELAGTLDAISPVPGDPQPSAPVETALDG